MFWLDKAWLTICGVVADLITAKVTTMTISSSVLSDMYFTPKSPLSEFDVAVIVYFSFRQS